MRKKVSNGNYVYVIIKNHPNATKNGYIYEHRAIIENYIGRILNINEVVHHINGNTKDNRIENLELMSRSEHSKQHIFSRGRKTVLLKCPECGIIFEIKKSNSFLQNKSKYSACSKYCSAKFSHRLKNNKNLKDIKKRLSENFIKEYKKFL